ncbi:MAG: bifunctional glutamate N-acetyltransferase/amino-acid acetyltransferase ArgJ [Actinobacteria bacterium]|nr:bifunctional glutamate N-acetyltransferase/amino-acid acetyltransferase ArgJ [Actinomycetota bacterium]
MSVTTPKGFDASGVAAGLKSSGEKDVALIVNNGPKYDASAVFTTNKVKAAPVVWTQEVIKNKKLKAVVLNSGGANACTGPEGFADTHLTAEHVAKMLSVGAIEIGVCSTGLIGNRLDMTKLISGINDAYAKLSPEGGQNAAAAITTTDSHEKIAQVEKDSWSIGGIIKGAGMLAPDMATMLCVITTDADISQINHQLVLQQCADLTLNRIDSDGCTSTNDTVILMSSGASLEKPTMEDFKSQLQTLMSDLSNQLINDAEGATKVIEIEVLNARNEHEAVDVGRSIARNNLLKCAMFGEDPNWGRILAAVGTADAEIDSDKIDVYLNNARVCANGSAIDLIEKVSLNDRNISIKVDLKIGTFSATIYTNDLSTQYVHENSAYST